MLGQNAIAELALGELEGGVTLAVGLVANSETFYAASASARVTISPSLATNANSFNSATVTPGAVTLAAALYSNNQTIYAATVSRGAVTLAPSVLANSSTIFASSVSYFNGIAAGLFSNSQSYYVPVVSVGSVTISPSIVSNSSVFPLHTISIVGATQYVLPGLLANTQTFFGSVASATYGVTAPFVANSQTIYSASVSASKTLAVLFYQNATSFYTASVSGGSVTLVPSLHTNGNGFYAHTISTSGATQNIDVPLIDSQAVIYAATLAGGVDLATIVARLDAIDATLAAMPQSIGGMVIEGTLTLADIMRLLLSGMHSDGTVPMSDGLHDALFEFLSHDGLKVRLAGRVSPTGVRTITAIDPTP